MQNPWKKLDSKIMYKNPWITVREDKVITPSGSEGIYGVVEAGIAAVIIAMTEHQELYLVGQYRYTVDMYSWELIMGGADLEEDPLKAAQRELQEEAGLSAHKWTALGDVIQVSNCFTNQLSCIYIAEDLEEVESQPDSTEDLQIKKVSFSEAMGMARNGEITDALSLVGLYRLKDYLEKIKW